MTDDARLEMREDEMLAWAIARLKKKADEKRHHAGSYGTKLLRGYGYPDSVMHDAQDALALETVLAALLRTEGSARQEEPKGRGSVES